MNIQPSSPEGKSQVSLHLHFSRRYQKTIFLGLALPPNSHLPRSQACLPSTATRRNCATVFPGASGYESAALALADCRWPVYCCGGLPRRPPGGPQLPSRSLFSLTAGGFPTTRASIRNRMLRRKSVASFFGHYTHMPGQDCANCCRRLRSSPTRWPSSARWSPAIRPALDQRLSDAHGHAAYSAEP